VKHLGVTFLGHGVCHLTYSSDDDDDYIDYIYPSSIVNLCILWTERMKQSFHICRGYSRTVKVSR